MEQFKSKDDAIAYAKNPANRIIVAIPLLVVASFIFYVLSSFFFALGGGDSQESSSMAGIADSNAADAFSKI